MEKKFLIFFETSKDIISLYDGYEMTVENIITLLNENKNNNFKDKLRNSLLFKLLKNTSSVSVIKENLRVQKEELDISVNDDKIRFNNEY